MPVPIPSSGTACVWNQYFQRAVAHTLLLLIYTLLSSIISFYLLPSLPKHGLHVLCSNWVWHLCTTGVGICTCTCTTKVKEVNHLNIDDSADSMSSVIQHWAGHKSSLLSFASQWCNACQVLLGICTLYDIFISCIYMYVEHLHMTSRKYILYFCVADFCSRTRNIESIIIVYSEIVVLTLLLATTDTAVKFSLEYRVHSHGLILHCTWVHKSWYTRE